MSPSSAAVATRWMATFVGPKAVRLWALSARATSRLCRVRENPIVAVRWQKPKVSTQVDPRVVANPEQARNLLAAVSYVGGYRRARGRRLVGLFAAMYFGGLRPAEAVGIVEADLKLPKQGWGSALLHRTPRPSASSGPTRGRPTTTAD